jgi:hypothetical protein
VYVRAQLDGGVRVVVPRATQCARLAAARFAQLACISVFLLDDTVVVDACISSAYDRNFFEVLTAVTQNQNVTEDKSFLHC